MNTKLYLVGALCIAALLCMVPVSAFSQQIDIGGGLNTPSFSMSIASGGYFMPLAIGTIDVTGPVVTTTSNTGWTIAAKDAMLSSKPAPGAGKMMANNNVSFTWGTALQQPFQIGYNSGSYTSLTASDQIIHTGTPGSTADNLKFRQVVVAADPVLSPGNQYLLAVLATGSATP